MNRTTIYNIYVAMLKQNGQVTRCEKVLDDLYAIEYTFTRTTYSSFCEGCSTRFWGRTWLGEMSAFKKYFNNLYLLKDETEHMNWSDDNEIYHKLAQNINKYEELDAIRNDRNISANSPKRIFAKIRETIKRWFVPNTQPSNQRI